MIKLELLAPARNKETAICAIKAGADAVYIGGPALSARYEASNSMEDIKELCNFAKLFNVKVYLTINTLLYDKELASAQELLYQASDAGVSAIIFQDPAILMMDIPKGLELHASTQCDISDVERFLFYKNLNVAQVVIPRELSLENIQKINEVKGNVKLEAFVAGSLCVAQSGICYISELLTKRSANRGQCAQICRLAMQMYDKDDKCIAQGHLLSMKDNWSGNDLFDLVNVGVSSFKIEGRLKDKEYVTNVTARMRQLLDEIISREPLKYTRASDGKVQINFKADEHKTFNRGFTNSLLHGSNANLINIKSPKSIGNFIGYVKACKIEGKHTKLLVDKLTTYEFANGDAFSYYDENSNLQGFRCNNAKVSNKVLELSVPKVLKLKVKTQLYRNVDNLFIKSIVQKDAVLRYIEVKASLYIKANQLCYCLEDEYCKAISSIEYTKSEGNLLIAKAQAKLTKSNNPYIKIIDFSSELISLDCDFATLSTLKQQCIDSFISKKQNIHSDYIYIKPSVYPHFDQDSVDSRLILNKLTRSFYQKCGVDTSKMVKPIVRKSQMTCRNCLVKNHAICKKDGGKTFGYYLMIGNKRFDIFCDCKACKMHLLYDEI